MEGMLREIAGRDVSKGMKPKVVRSQGNVVGRKTWANKYTIGVMGSLPIWIHPAMWIRATNWTGNHQQLWSMVIPNITRILHGYDPGNRWDAPRCNGMNQWLWGWHCQVLLSASTEVLTPSGAIRKLGFGAIALDTWWCWMLVVPWCFKHVLSSSLQMWGWLDGPKG